MQIIVTEVDGLVVGGTLVTIYVLKFILLGIIVEIRGVIGKFPVKAN